MSERSKYAMNGVFKCENFEHHLAAGRFPELNIGYSPWHSRVYITMKPCEELNQVYPYIEFAATQKRKIRAFFNIKSKFWSLCYQTNGTIYLEPGAGVSGPPMNIQDVLNEENGYLEKGAFTVECGLQVEAILEYHDIWIFNLHNKLFNSEKENNAITINYRLSGGVFHSPKALLAFHSPLFGHETKEVFPEAKVLVLYAHCYLQIANGVRLQNPGFHGHHWFKIAEIGRKMNMMNAVRYCDSMIIRTCPNVLRDKRYQKLAIKLNMRQCAPRMMEQWNFKDLLEELREDLDGMPGEMMKVLVARFIKEEF